MRIAFLVVHFPVAAETPFLNQVTGLLDRGHDVRIHADSGSRSARDHPDVLAYRLGERTTWLPPAERLPARLRLLATHWRCGSRQERAMLRRALDPRLGPAARSLGLVRQVVRYLPGQRFDVIQGCFGGDGLRAVRLRRIGALAGPVVTAFRGVDVTRYLRRRGSHAYAELFREGERFLPVSDSLAAELRAAGCPPERIQVHRTGIQLRHHPFRPRLRPAGRPVRLVSVGRLVEKKGIADALAVIGTLRAEGRAVEYHVIGQGPLQAALERRAAGLPPGTVRFHGALLPAEVRDRLEAMDLLLAPHRTAADGDTEGVPNALKEAMALGLPVVTTRHGGIPELVEDGESGLLAPEGDVAALVDRCRWLLDHPEAWPRLTAAARQVVERHYDIDQLNDRLVAIYEDVAARAATAPSEAPTP